MDNYLDMFDANLETPQLPAARQPHAPLSLQTSVIGFPETLPVEIALHVAPLPDILEAYGLTEDQFTDLAATPAFVAAMKNATEMVARDGMSFRLKARLQADELLKTSWALIHDKETAASVRADLIKFTVKCAGLETSVNENKGTTIQPLQININLG